MWLKQPGESLAHIIEKFSLKLWIDQSSKCISLLFSYLPFLSIIL